MEINQSSDYKNLSGNPSLKEIKIEINGSIVLEFEISKNFSDLPFFCFPNSNVSSIEELNFNELKNCSAIENNKYMVIFLGDFIDKTSTLSELIKNFNTWHNKNPQVKLELIETSNSYIELDGKMLKIFHQQYKPTT